MVPDTGLVDRHHVRMRGQHTQQPGAPAAGGSEDSSEDALGELVAVLYTHDRNCLLVPFLGRMVAVCKLRFPFRGKGATQQSTQDSFFTQRLLLAQLPTSDAKCYSSPYS